MSWGQQEVTEHTKQHLRDKRERKKKTTHPGEQLFQLLRRQTLVPGGIFQMTPCMAQGSSLSFKRGKAKASLADMHGAHKHVT